MVAVAAFAACGPLSRYIGAKSSQNKTSIAVSLSSSLFRIRHLQDHLIMPSLSVVLTLLTAATSFATSTSAQDPIGPNMLINSNFELCPGNACVD